MIPYTISTATAVNNTGSEVWNSNVGGLFRDYDAAVRKAEQLVKMQAVNII